MHLVAKRMMIDNPSARECSENRPSQLNERAPQSVIVHALCMIESRQSIHISISRKIGADHLSVHPSTAAFCLAAHRHSYPRFAALKPKPT